MPIVHVYQINLRNTCLEDPTVIYTLQYFFLCYYDKIVHIDRIFTVSSISILY